MQGSLLCRWTALSVALVFVYGCADSQLPNLENKAKTENQLDLKGYILRDTSGSRIAIDAAEPIKIKASHLMPSHVRGGRIYDNFAIELDVVGTGPNPLLDLAIGTPPATAEEGWHCSTCHGFDYEGGSYTFNNGATNNLLELKDVRGRDEDFVVNMLMNGFDAWDGTAVVNVHNYTGLLTDQAMVDVADFVVNEIFDTHAFIRAPTSGSLGDHMVGMAMYNSVPVANGAIPPMVRVDGSNFNCMDCHGADGLGTGLAGAGVNLHLSAWSDPFKFLHRTLFGAPRSLATNPDFIDPAVMPGLYEVILTDGLHFGGAEQGADLMAHAQVNLAGP